MFGFLLGTLTSLTNAHAVRGRPTLNYQCEYISAWSFREHCLKALNAMKALNATKASNAMSYYYRKPKLLLKANLLHLNSTRFYLTSYRCMITMHIRTRMLYKRDAMLDICSTPDINNQIKDSLKQFVIVTVCIIILEML